VVVRFIASNTVYRHTKKGFSHVIYINVNSTTIVKTERMHMKRVLKVMISKIPTLAIKRTTNILFG
jgi:hypothetical protein